MSCLVTGACPWFTHWLCVVPPRGSLCHRTLSTPSLSLTVQKSAPGPEEAKYDKVSVAMMERPKELDAEMTL